jgi:hypothetical protein
MGLLPCPPTPDAPTESGLRSLHRRCCPLNHRAVYRSYPQLWRAGHALEQNRPVWPSDPPCRHELQPCKLPTVWITPVDNARREGGIALPVSRGRPREAAAAAKKARPSGRAVATLWKTTHGRKSRRGGRRAGRRRKAAARSGAGDSECGERDKHGQYHCQATGLQQPLSRTAGRVDDNGRAQGTRDCPTKVRLPGN